MTNKNLNQIIGKDKSLDFSIAIIGLNCEDKIKNTLESIKNFKEIIYVDNGSTDKTCEIVKKYTNKIFINNEKDFSLLRNFALSKSTNNWALFLDSDEFIEKNEMDIILKTFAEKKDNCLGFWIKRKNFINNKNNIYLKYGLFYPDWQLRLIKKPVTYTNTPHEEPNIEKQNTFYINANISHNLNPNKLFKFFGFKENLKVAKVHAKNLINYSYWYLFGKIITAPFTLFLNSLLRGKGILDGYFGIIAAHNFTLHIISIYYFAIIYKIKEKRIKIAIDAGDFSPNLNTYSGIFRFTKCFYNEAINDENYIFNFYSFSKNKNVYKNNLTFKTLPEKFFAGVFLPLKILLDKNKVYLGFSGYLPKILKYFKIKKIIFIYDLGFYKYPQLYKNFKKLQNNTEFAILNSDLIITFSKYIAFDIKKYFPESANKIKIIYSGGDHLKEFTNPTINNYFLYVGIIKETKNIERLINIFYEYLKKNPKTNEKLVIIGKKTDNYFKKISQLIATYKIKERIIFLENINDKELLGYYKKSICFLNFSHEEGICLPLLEALNTNKIAILSNIDLYHEYKETYKDSIVICNSNSEILSTINAVKNNSKKINNLENPLTWKKFYNNLINLIK